ncbi:MAG: hypothetical protein IT465_01585 [Moraxellaceae bacterium]|nr:hypothetical protein [Moraxellaceae bacterium]
MDAEAIVFFVAIIALKVFLMVKLDLSFWEAGGVIKLTVLIGIIIYSYLPWNDK